MTENLQTGRLRSAYRTINTADRPVIIAFGGDHDDHHALHLAAKTIVSDLTAADLTARHIDCNRAGGLEWLITQPDALIWVIDPYRNTYHQGEVTASNIATTLTAADLTVVSQSARCAELTRNKRHTKQLAEAAGLTVADDVVLITPDTTPDAQQLLATHGSVIVKPIDGSEGRLVTKATTPAELIKAAATITTTGTNPLIEQYLPGPELSVPVIATTVEPSIALPATEIRTAGAIFNRTTKNDQTTYKLACPPTSINPATVQAATNQALALTKALGATGPLRVDFIISDEQPTLLEANSFPGLAPTGRYAQALHKHQWTLGDLATIVLADHLIST